MSPWPSESISSANPVRGDAKQRTFSKDLNERDHD